MTIMRSRGSGIVRVVKGIRYVEPKSAPCGHIPPTFDRTSGNITPITRHPHDTEFLSIKAAVWCSECGWVNITNEDFHYYKDFNSAQAA